MFKKLSGNILIYGGTNAIKSLVPFLMLPLLTSYLSTQEYGELMLIETTIIFLLPFIMLNINGAINVEYFHVKNDKEYKQYVLNALLLSVFSFLFISFFFFIFQNQIANFLHIDKQWIQLLGVFAFLRVPSSILLVIFQVMHKAKFYAYFSIAQTIVDFSLSYYLVVILDYGITGRLLGVYSAFLIFNFITVYLLYTMQYFKTGITFKYTKKILAFGLPLFPHAVGGIVLSLSDRYFISYFYDNSEVGQYSVAYQVSSILLLISLSVNQAWSPFFFSLMKEKKKYMITKGTKILALLYIVSSISLFFISPYIYDFMIDEKFYESKMYFIYLLIGFLFQSFYFLFTNYLFFYKKTVLLSYITLSGALLNICLNYIFIKSYGVVGVAYATMITYAVYFFMVLVMANKVNREYGMSSMQYSKKG